MSSLFKFLVSFLLIFYINNCFGQENLPFYTLKVDLINYDLNRLYIKEIQQIKTYKETVQSINKSDSIVTYSTLEYVIKYDSLNQTKTVFFDMEKDYAYNANRKGIILFDSNNLNKLNPLNPVENLHPFISDKDTIYYNYYENVYQYEDNQLKLIESKIPLRYFYEASMLKKSKPKDLSDKNYFENKELNFKGFTTTKYYYKWYFLDKKLVKLVSKVIEKFDDENNTKIIHKLKYKFY
jgi:uncharacterized protein with von Willebrand factor type A (vWA) domain